MSKHYLDELFCKAISNCEKITCLRCSMFSIKPLKNNSHCLVSELMKEVQRIKKEIEASND